MRPIEFRAWFKKSKEMFKVDCINFKSRTITLIRRQMAGMWSFEDIELMQFTGLLDKNGKKIFEGDIVHFIDGNYQVSWCEIRYGGGYCAISENNHRQLTAEIEVIGNIYENPELLEGK
jgi:uncharacterized phage protein (TIGR01671 family)